MVKADLAGLPRLEGHIKSPIGDLSLVPNDHYRALGQDANSGKGFQNHHKDSNDH
jgi:hypothetical protein